MRRALPVAFCLAAALIVLPAERAASAAPWGLPQLMASLRQVKSASGQFVERKTLKLVSRPLVASGTLLYVAPDQVQKITVAPQWQRLAVDGDTLTMEGGPDDRSRTLSLSSYPQVAAFVEGIRATLAGDLAALQSFYDVQLTGAPDAWQLRLQPKEPKLRKLVQWIRIGGDQDRIRTVETQESDGDHSEMSIVEDIHDGS
jgi:outer membrane lipoprotein-sorting protein